MAKRRKRAKKDKPKKRPPRRAWGNIAWRDGKAYGRVRINGSRTWRLLKNEDGTVCTTALEAEPAMERLRQSVEARRAMAAGERARLGYWLDEEYADIIGSRCTPHVAAQAEAYICRFAAWMDVEIGRDAYMDEVRREHAERFVADFVAGRVLLPNRKTRASYKPGYIRRIVNTLRAAWNAARDRGFVSENPWSKLPLPRIAETIVPWVEPADLAAIAAEVGDHFRPLVRLLAGTGLRVSEGLALRREDVDLRARVLHVRSGKTRTARRTVPLPDDVVALVKSLPPRDDGLLLDPVSNYGTLRAIQAACEHLKLPRLTVHQLRHVYASHLVVTGTPPTVVAALLGHADGGSLVLRLYGRWYPQDAQARAVQTLDAFRSKPGSAPA